MQKQRNIVSKLIFLLLQKLNERCMVFASSHHIGLQLLPIDGNPYKALGYRASATPVSWLFF